MPQVKLNGMLFARMIRMLQDPAGQSVYDIASETGLHPVTVQRYLRELRRAGAAYICAWQQDSRGRDAIKVYRLGEGREARRRKLTPAQRQARSRAKKAMLAVTHLTAGSSTSIEGARL